MGVAESSPFVWYIAGSTIFFLAFCGFCNRKNDHRNTGHVGKSEAVFPFRYKFDRTTGTLIPVVLQAPGEAATISEQLVHFNSALNKCTDPKVEKQLEREPVAR